MRMTELTAEQKEQRIKTIELLNPDWLNEMRDCANKLGVRLEDFIRYLDEAVDDDGFVLHTGDLSIGSYQFDWNKIWAGYELLTLKRVPASRWANPQIPFSCAC